MTKGGKQFLARLFMALAIATWLGWVIFDYFDYWFSPTVQVVFTAAAYIMFKMASNDKSEDST